jgi:hypothetical protein
MRPRFYTFLFTFLVNVIFCLNIFSKQLNVQDALSAAIESTKPLDALTRQNILNATQATTESNYSLLHTEQAEELNTVYIMESQTDNRVIFISADDVARPLLGWCDASTFDITNLPPALQYMLDSYSKEICIASAAGSAPYTPQSSDNRPEIAPLITTKWHQTAPYNLLCPEDSDRRCVTGCVATAMAQIMNFHRWPESGTGAITYTAPTDGNNSNLTEYSMDFSATTFDWDNMLDEYNGDESEDQINAVALLMKACGYGSKMIYGLNGTSSSGASIPDAISAFNNYFKYAPDITLELRTAYNLNVWIDILYDELKSRRPLLTSGGIHAFLIDGYQPDDLFHINWGWGGLSDGYYAITALNPGAEGTGASPGGYNIGLNIMAGLYPDNDRSKPRIKFTIGKTNFTTEKDKYIRAENGTVRYSPIFNEGRIAATVTTGIRLRNIETAEISYCTGNTQTMGQYTGTYLEIPISNHPQNGKYIVEPIIVHNGDIHNVISYINYRGYVLLDANDEKLVFTHYETSTPQLSLESYNLPDKIYAGKTFDLSVEIACSGREYIGNIVPHLIIDENNRTTYNSIYTTVTENGSTLLNWSNLTTPTDPGFYKLILYDLNQNQIGDSITIEVLDSKTNSPELSMLFECTATKGCGTKEQPWETSETDIMSVTVSNASGMYNDGIVFGLFDENDINLSAQNSGTMILPSGTSEARIYTVARLKTAFSLNYDTMYAFGIYYRPEGETAFHAIPGSNKYYFTIKTTAGIEEIKADDDRVMIRYADGRITVESAGGIRQIDVFTTQGSIIASATYPYADTKAEISIDALPGIYIIRATTNGGKTVTQKVAIR